MSRAIGATLAGPALLMLLGAMAFSGQPGDTDEKAKDKKDSEPRKQATKLVILVEAKAEQTKEDVLKTLLKGAALAKCTFEGTPDLKPTPATFFRLLRQLEPPTEQEESGKEKQDVSIRQSLDDPMNWRVVVHQPKGAQLMKLEVNYARAGKREYEPKKWDPPSDFPLLEMLPQTYVLRQSSDKAVERTDSPQKFVAHLETRNPKKTWTSRGDVDAGPRYFMVTFTNFQGELAKLFEIIKDGARVPNPVEDVKADETIQLVFASWQSRIPHSDEFDGFVYKPRFMRLPKRRVVRVWMHFPVTKKKADDLLEEYLKHKDPEKLVQKVRAESPMRGKDSVTVGASTEPRWYELPDASEGKLDYFSRDFPLQNFRDLQQKFPEAYRLVIYEFEPEGGKSDQDVAAIQVLDPATKRGTYVQLLPIPGWPARLERLAQEEEKQKKEGKLPKPTKDK